MRTIITGFIICLCLTSVFGQAKTGRLEISHLTEDFYVYTTYGTYKSVSVPANAMYMLTSKGVVLFDTPWDSTTFQPLLDSKGYCIYNRATYIPNILRRTGPHAR